jgi:hypothetical protein
LPEFESYILRGPMARYNLGCNSQIYDDRICCPENGFQFAACAVSIWHTGTMSFVVYLQHGKIISIQELRNVLITKV